MAGFPHVHPFATFPCARATVVDTHKKPSTNTGFLILFLLSTLDSGTELYAYTNSFRFETRCRWDPDATSFEPATASASI